MGRRQTNFEALRLICMWLVVETHIVQFLHPEVHTGPCLWPAFAINVGLVSVNCFVFISGFFRIRLSWKGVLRLWTQCSFFALLLGAVACLWFGAGWVKTLWHGIFSLTDDRLWFLPCYFALMLFSPILNKGIEGVEGKTALLSLVIDVYIGYMHQAEVLTDTGYHFVHFVALYCVGAWLSTCKAPSKGMCYFLWWLLLIVMETALRYLKFSFPYVAAVYSFRLNSPLVILSSILFFQWVRTWKWQSKWVCWASSSALAVYVVHFGPMATPLFWQPVRRCHEQGFGYLLLYAVGFYVGCILLDKIRILVCNPLVANLAPRLERISDQILKKKC